uniref:Uncharacterized protein n=1 Tax=Romanomermis culicivorax TaxID=13658 RepID=A0A915IGT7_ROMCU
MDDCRSFILQVSSEKFAVKKTVPANNFGGRLHQSSKARAGAKPDNFKSVLRFSGCMKAKLNSSTR